MASPPRAYSPAGSPPYSSSAQLPSKKRGSTTADLSSQPPSLKRRKASVMSVASVGSAHPLRQTSFPPDESQIQAFSPSYRRSPSVDTMSLVSGSQVSGVPAKKKRGRKSKAERASEAAAEAMRDGSPSVAGGRAATVISNVSGNHAGKDADPDSRKEEEFEIPENMASMSAARTKEQIEEEKELNALLKTQMDALQFDRYEVWHRQTLKGADVKRHINSVTSQSCPTNVHQMMQVVCKMYLGDIVESAREVQQEWVQLGEKQTDLSDDDLEPANELSKHRRQAPLRPEHLREAYRRRKAGTENGGSLGSLMVWNQQTQNGVERFAVRAGGRRIFK
ncbi:transcription initiation factor TFIID-like protein [Daldinia vernicosa]|uniref:transcription initiation factor TFIID-like protein n=1 Tax=Daldinia vernicosa TaxID=114800 RepID=UPI0020081D0B|nr:transcription initiation factor TFIID-like protein [Daldinia vernicosa]KAI0849978.1 transcription initiation factor TFIID-like protein [Daldinia vernicosa]